MQDPAYGCRGCMYGTHLRTGARQKHGENTQEDAAEKNPDVWGRTGGWLPKMANFPSMKIARDTSSTTLET